MKYAQWEGFNSGNYEYGIDVRNFIQSNYVPYEGDASFLSGRHGAYKTAYEPA